ncbi:MAG: DUF815 domain-containing protein [Pseudomonadota bacterium]
MSARRDTFERIAAALERIAPPVSPPADWTNAPAFVWSGDGVLAILEPDALPLGAFRGIDEQKATVRDNLERLASGASAHDMLLWGARGMGKSALVRAAVADIQKTRPDALAIVQINPASLTHFAQLIEELAGQSRAFLLFIDDLGFGEGQNQDNLVLRSLLDGGVIPRPDNIRLGVTSNRRAIVRRVADESEQLHARDDRDDALALADRFGLTVGFHPCDRETYLAILRGYTEPVGLEVDEEEALAWAIARGSRSGRSAYQFATELAGRAGLKL